ncbi:MAG: hypothetical protein RMJ51_06560 [Candidatus Calescibacterium sp.]|nr:hypothetical protein [Candidatus Calescibacterium sp.]MCX7972805.1 hypothetical protein [bacterium]MDW8195879.1 hypothetical protein [Candidatus Calescibacterium sp.]
MNKIFLFFLFVIIFPFAVQKYRESIIINYVLDDFYTGRIDGKLFIGKNLFLANSLILVPNIHNFSEGISIHKMNNSRYFLLSNTNSFGFYDCLLVVFFSRDLSIMNTSIFKTSYPYNLIKVFECYENNMKKFYLLGLIKDLFDFEICISRYDGDKIEESVKLGTNFIDYPIYFSEYESDKFKGYVLLSLCVKSTYVNFIDIRFNMDIKRFNTDSMLVCFIDQEMKISKYFVIRFPSNIIDYSIVKRSIDSVLLRVDFIDKIYGYHLTNNFIHIDFNDVRFAGYRHKELYVDNFFYFKHSSVDFSKIDVKIVFNKVEERLR